MTRKYVRTLTGDGRLTLTDQKGEEAPPGLVKEVFDDEKRLYGESRTPTYLPTKMPDGSRGFVDVNGRVASKNLVGFIESEMSYRKHTAEEWADYLDQYKKKRKAMKGNPFATNMKDC